MRRLAQRAAISAFLAAAAAASGAQEPEKLFDELFGAEARKVAATGQTLDDVEFARKLLTSAETLTADKALAALLCQKACEFALKNPKGYPTVTKALGVLENSAGERIDQWQEIRLELYRRRYRLAKGTAKRAAGELLVTQGLLVGDAKAKAGQWDEAEKLYYQAVATAGYIRSSARDQAAEKLAYAKKMVTAQQLKAQLKAKPDNATVRSALVRLCVIELDDPAAAVPYINPSVDEVYRTYVPLAAKSRDDLPVQVCLELGNWYKSLAFSAGGPNTKGALAQRARKYYLAYVQKALVAGQPRADVERARKQINASLRQIGLKPLAAEATLRDPALQKAMEKAIAFLWSRQSSDGSWAQTRTRSPRRVGRSPKANKVGRPYIPPRVVTSPTSSGANVGAAAPIVHALLAAGVSLDDERMAKAVKYLEKFTHLTNGIAFRSLVWYRCQEIRPGIYVRGLKSDVMTLLRGTSTGGYYDNVGYRSSQYNAYSWAPAMGVDAGERMNIRVPRRFWTLTLSYWAKQQKPDGGWSYYASSRTAIGASSYYSPSMLWTATGTATVGLCLKNLYGPDKLKAAAGREFDSFRQGLAWLDKHAATGVHGGSSLSYTGTVADRYYQLSRVALLGGRKQFGNFGWWDKGRNYFIRSQNADGSWGSLDETATVLLFLVNGQKFKGQDTGGQASPTTAPAASTVADDPVRRIALKRIETLKARLADKPTSQSIAKELVRLYVVELRDPDSASPYADKTGDENVAKLLGLAARPLADLPEASCLQLGAWYHTLTAGSSNPGREYALSQAERCYARFLELHTTGDAAKLKATLSLQKIREALKEFRKDD